MLSDRWNDCQWNQAFGPGGRGLVPRLIALRAGPARVPKLAELVAHSRWVQTGGMADGPKIHLVLKKEGFGFLPGTLRPRDPFLHCLCQYAVHRRCSGIHCRSSCLVLIANMAFPRRRHLKSCGHSRLKQARSWPADITFLQSIVCPRTTCKRATYPLRLNRVLRIVPVPGGQGRTECQSLFHPETGAVP